MILTWNSELGTLTFKGEMGNRLKQLFITVCMLGKSLPVDYPVSVFAPEAMAWNNDKPLSVSHVLKTKAAQVFADSDSVDSSNHVSAVRESKCDCQCGLLAAELEGVKLDLVILQKSVDTKINTSQKTYNDEVAQLRSIYDKERERCEQLKSDISILVKGREREINELNNIIVSLENKVESLEASNASLRKSITTKHIQNNNDTSITSKYVNGYANPKPFTPDDSYIKTSNNIEYPPLQLPYDLSKEEATNDHARTGKICQSYKVSYEYMRHINNQPDPDKKQLPISEICA